MNIILVSSILIAAIAGIVFVPNASAMIQFDYSSEYMNYTAANGTTIFVPYKLTTNPSTVIVETKDGSYTYDKNSCAISFYKGGSISGQQPVIKSDSYVVKASNTANGTANWLSVNVINNAACSTQVLNDTNKVTIIGTKTVAGTGVFQINYTKVPFLPVKVSMSATNNNAAWTNYHLGLTETMQVPQFVTLGNQTFDLSLYNNTVLSRSWITSHHSQLITLANHLKFNMGLGWKNVNQITIYWINNQASLAIDYTFNTPIISPGQTILIDPSITFDSNSGTINTAGLSAANTQTETITVGNNANRALFQTLSYQNAGTSILSVQLGSVNFTKAVTINNGGQFVDIWYLKNPNVGAGQTITVTVLHTGSYYMHGIAESLYNVNQASPVGVTATNTAPTTITITPTTTGSWLLAASEANGGNYAAPSDTQIYNINDGANISSAAQRKQNPTIGGANTLTWTEAATGSIAAIEIKTSVQVPIAPTISKYLALNSTAIQLTWSNSPGATWFQLNRTSPQGGTTWVQVVNSSATSKIDNGLTPGTQYEYKVVAGNSTGSSPASNTVENYTKNVAPTSPTISLITATSSRVTVTNPSGNFSGYKIYIAPVSTGVYTLAGTTSTTTNFFDFTSLAVDRNFEAQLSTRYAVGSNYSGLSSNSTVVTWYTLPNTPGGLALSQTVVNVLHLVWVASVGGDNPVQGYKIERSIDFGATWITIVANTGNTGVTYDDSGLVTGNTYTYRVSTIKISGTSAPTAPVSATVLSSIQLNPTGTTTVPFNTTRPVITWNVVNRDNQNWDMFIDTTNNGTAVSWYHAKITNSTIVKMLGYGVSTITMTGTPNIYTNNNGSYGYGFQSNNGWLYMVNTAKSVDHYYIGNGTKKHDFTAQTDCATVIGDDALLVNQASQPIWNSNTFGGCQSGMTTKTEGNATVAGSINWSPQYATSTTNNHILWDFNSTAGLGITPPQCSLFQVNNNFTTTLLPDKIACDWSIQQSIYRYYSGLQFHKQGNVYSTNALDLFTMTNMLPSTTKLLMTADSNVLDLPNNIPNSRLILHTSNGDYLVVLTSSHIYYQLVSNILINLQSGTRAYQDYIVTPFSTPIPMQLSALTSKASLTIYANGLNNTESLMGLTQLISGYTYRGTSIYGTIRAVDPQWTDDQTNIPLITTTTNLFPIFLTVSNSPVTAALMVTNPAYVISNIAGVWTVTLLDVTRSAEFDIPANQCGLVYIADTSKQPTIWNYEGQICATGVNQKTIAYINTLPLNFFTLQYGVSSSYVPQTNGLTTIFHSTTPGTTYNVQIKNSTGTVAQSYSFSLASNQTLDTRAYNITGVSKPASLTVSVAGNQIYTAYLGSPLSLASVASFFHQYLNYQGFDFLCFIPLIFAAMFTRNTVGIGTALVVVLIATLSFLSIVVVPDTVIYISIIVAAIGMIGYRGLYG